MKHASLFSGIGGFDLAAEWVGWENEFHCEWNEFGKRVLNYYWPKAKSYDNITKTDFTEWRGRIDVLTGGFPCQPYSVAGKRLGKEDERHLWPHMLRAIQEIQPRYVVGENVRGLISWNGGLVFDEVQADLETEGYTVIPCVLPACGVNAPHRRERVWFVAYRERELGETLCGVQSEQSIREVFSDNGECGIAPDTDSSTTRAPRESGSSESSRCQNDDVESERRVQAELDNRPFEFLQSTTDTDTDNARNATSRSSIDGNRQAVISERKLTQSEFSGHSFTADTDNQRDSTGPRSLSEANGEISKRNEDAEFSNAGSGDVTDTESFRGRELRQSGGEKGSCCGNVLSGEQHRISSEERNATDLHNERLERGENDRSSGESREDSDKQFTGCFRTTWKDFPTQPPICGGDDGLSRELDGITFPKWRSESIKAYGNAIVPVVAYEIFKVIDKLDKELLRYL